MTSEPPTPLPLLTLEEKHIPPEASSKLPPLAQQRHKRRYAQWWQRVTEATANHRGSRSALARSLGVSRQTVSRWFAPHGPNPPGWAAIAINIWSTQQLTAWAETTTPAHPTLCPPGE